MQSLLHYPVFSNNVISWVEPVKFKELIAGSIADGRELLDIRFLRDWKVLVDSMIDTIYWSWRVPTMSNFRYLKLGVEVSNSFTKFFKYAKGGKENLI